MSSRSTAVASCSYNPSLALPQSKLPQQVRLLHPTSARHRIGMRQGAMIHPMKVKLMSAKADLIKRDEVREKWQSMTFLLLLRVWISWQLYAEKSLTASALLFQPIQVQKFKQRTNGIVRLQLCARSAGCARLFSLALHCRSGTSRQWLWQVLASKYFIFVGFEPL